MNRRRRHAGRGHHPGSSAVLPWKYYKPSSIFAIINHFQRSHWLRQLRATVWNGCSEFQVWFSWWFTSKSDEIWMFQASSGLQHHFDIPTKRRGQQKNSLFTNFVLLILFWYLKQLALLTALSKRIQNRKRYAILKSSACNLTVCYLNN